MVGSDLLTRLPSGGGWCYGQCFSTPCHWGRHHPAGGNMEDTGRRRGWFRPACSSPCCSAPSSYVYFMPLHTDTHRCTHSHTHSHTQTQRRSEALNLWKIARNCGMLDWRILGENLGRIVGNLKNLNAPLHPKGLRNQNHWIMFEEAQRIPKNPRESLKISKNPPRIPWHPKNPQESKDYTIRIIGFSSRNPQESPRIPKNPQISLNISTNL